MFRTLLFPLGLLLSPPHCPKPNHRSPVLPSQSKWYCPSINKIWKNGGKVRGKNKKRAQKPATSWHLWADQWFQRCRQACMAGLSPVQDIMYFRFANFITIFFYVCRFHHEHYAHYAHCASNEHYAYQAFCIIYIIGFITSWETCSYLVSNELWKQDTVCIISRNKYIGTYLRW